MLVALDSRTAFKDGLADLVLMADLAEGRGRLVDHQREGELTAAKRVDQIPLRGIDTRRLQDVRRKKKSLLQGEKRRASSR